jgi:hypothetical protein
VEANCADNQPISKEQRGYFVDSVTIGDNWAGNVKQPARSTARQQNDQSG